MDGGGSVGTVNKWLQLKCVYHLILQQYIVIRHNYLIDLMVF
jgi:hypothetical protein